MKPAHSGFSATTCECTALQLLPYQALGFDFRVLPDLLLRRFRCGSLASVTGNARVMFTRFGLNSANRQKGSKCSSGGRMPRDIEDANMSTAIEPIWAVTPEKLAEATRRLVAAAQPKKIILFGSRARGDARGNSDVDLLVIVREVKDRVGEMVRLNRALKGLILPVELIVISERMFEDLADTPGTVYFEAKREGEVLYESP